MSMLILEVKYSTYLTYDYGQRLLYTKIKIK